MSHGLFITGTDTGVGKTIVTAGLVRRFRLQGIKALPMKPVQTGGEADATPPIAPDLDFVCRVAGIAVDPALRRHMCPYLYRPPCSPHLAGRMAGSYVSIQRIVESGIALGIGSVVVAEGAGGVLTPINETQTMLDLMDALNWPVVLVARGGLGTINQTLLSLSALRSRNLKVLGVVICDSRPGPRDFIREDNTKAIAHFGRVEILGEVPYLGDLDSPQSPGDAWDRFDNAMTGIGRIVGNL